MRSYLILLSLAKKLFIICNESTPKPFMLIDFFSSLRDIIILMLKWTTSLKGRWKEHSRLISKVLNYLIKISPFKSKPVLVTNGTLLQNLLECWKGSYTISKSVLAEMLKSDSTTTRYAALQIVGVSMILFPNLFHFFTIILNTIFFPRCC